MISAGIVIDPAFRIGPVRRELFGSFVEHLGRCVYTGIYEPTHPLADEDGFRTDVLELVRELGVTNVRYPGGSFVSAYSWEDGVGPKDQRPSRADIAWHSVEPNEFGLDEFIRWCRKADVEPMMTVNTGTRGLKSALEVLEYSNVPRGTALADARRANGAEEPHNIRTWCIGNELDHRYTIGFKTAEGYAQLAAEIARAYRMHDSDLQLIVAGTSGHGNPTFGTWDRTLLEATYDEADMISVHAYHWIEDGDLASFLAAPSDTDRMFDGIIATADAVGASRHSDKKLDIAFDEWNVWYLPQFKEGLPEGDHWPVAPRLLEDRYTVADAVVVGGMLNSILRHADRIKYANLAQLVNVIAPIVTDPGGGVWKQTTFHPFALTSRFARGEALRVVPQVPNTETAKYGSVPVVDTTATLDDDGSLALFIVNRSAEETVDFTIAVHGIDELAPIEALTLGGTDPFDIASADHPIEPVANSTATYDGTQVRIELPPASWTMIRVRLV